MKRRRSPRSARLGLDCFTMVDELLASPTEPAPRDVHAVRISLAREALQLLRSPETATVTAWSICCMVGNCTETMLRQGLVADPDGLLQDAFDALKRAACAVRKPEDPISIPPADFAAVDGMIEDWVAILEQAAARDVVRAFRATDRRIREIEAGRTAPDDYAVTVSAAQIMGARL